MIAGGGQRARQALERETRTGHPGERFAIERDRFVDPAFRAQALGEVGEHAGVARLQLERTPAVARGGGGPAEPGERGAQQIVRVRVVGRGLEQAPTAAGGELGMPGAQLLLSFEQLAETARRE